MAQGNIVEQVSELITPIVDSMSLELVDLEYKHEGRDWFLRIFIDKDGGVTLDDCADLSREVDAVLEVADIIHTAFRLEVSSPGIDRPLKKPADFERFKGQRVKLKTYEKLDPDQRGHDRKTFVGQLQGLNNDRVQILQLDKKGGLIELALSDIAQAHLDPEF